MIFRRLGSPQFEHFGQFDELVVSKLCSVHLYPKYINTCLYVYIMPFKSSERA
jgi:hypothetical protein